MASCYDFRLISGVNFTNILQAAFALVDPKSVKKIENLTVVFMPLGSAHVKAVRRTLMKLCPDRVRKTNQIAFIDMSFAVKDVASATSKSS
jgi:hypothetical protein